MTRHVLLAAAVLLIGAWLRLHDLDARPLQSDEAVNWQLSGSHEYSPREFHGPLYFTVLKLLQPDSEVSLRVPGALCGILLVAAPLLLAGVLPRASLIMLMALIALDPLLIFYSRTAIHENLFVLLSTVTGLLVFRALEEGESLPLIAAGVTVGLMAATKETFMLPCAAIGISSLCVTRRFPWAVPGLSLLAMLGVIAVSYGGVEPLIEGVKAWTAQGWSDASQRQPWWYYAALLGRVDPAVLLSACLVPMFGMRRPFFTVWFLVIALVSSCIPYKTPWLAMSFVVPLYAATSVALGRLVLLVPLLVLLAAGPLDNSPLVANDTTEATRVLARRILDRCATRGPECRVFINLEWYWPLPFYLRKIGSQVAYAQTPPAVPIELFEVLLLPPEITGAIPGWTREEVQVSRLQRAAVYWKHR